MAKFQTKTTFLACFALFLTIGGCGSDSRGKDSLMVTCPKESYQLFTSSPGKAVEVQEHIYVGRVCVNCGGIHNPRLVFRDKTGKLFEVKYSTGRISDR